MDAKTVNLLGRVIIKGKIVALTGLHIGGAPVALEIGSVDLPVVRNPNNGQPYIPGSSLKGKMRSLSEKLTGAPQNYPIGRDVSIHIAGGRKRDYRSGEDHIKIGEAQYQKYWVNPIFGVPGEVEFKTTGPTRLVVRDVALDPKSLEKAKNLDMPYTEIKWENAIDRVTSAATPRQIERVPAGAVFEPMELVFSIYQESDVQLFRHVLTALQLLQDDYLGGHGSRGSGKVSFENLTLACRVGENYQTVAHRLLGHESSDKLTEAEKIESGKLSNLADSTKDEIIKWVAPHFKSKG